MKTKNFLFAGAIALSTVLSPMAAMTHAAPVFAAEYTVKNETDHSYTAYQIFKGSQAEGSTALGNVEWGANVDKSKMNELLAKDPNFSKDNVAMSAQEVADVLAATSDDSDLAKKFATIAHQAKTGDGVAIAAGDTSVNLPSAGYYLLVDKNGTGSDYVNLSLLQVTNKDEIQIRQKNSVPKFEKKVKDKNDTAGTESGWDDSADHDMTDEVPFRLQATLPTNLSEYSKYSIKFIDSLDSKAFAKPKNIKVYVENGNDSSNRVELTNGFTVGSITENTEKGTKEFTVDIDNVFTLTDKDGVKPTIVAGTKIVVEYEAVLQNSAALNKTQENTNKAKLEYSNNPNVGGDGDRGTTPEDTVRVFTYKLDVNKTDKEGNKLKGAGFTLYKKTPKGEGKFEWTKISDEITGPEMTEFEFKGLDDGEYKLEETTTPDGYNTIAPIEFTVSAEHDQESDDPQLTKLTFTKTSGGDQNTTFTVSDGLTAVSTTVVNTQGQQLPETGGMGTTLMYTLGTVLVAGAAVTYATNKRMKKED